jgi:hypothetical protein
LAAYGLPHPTFPTIGASNKVTATEEADEGQNDASDCDAEFDITVGPIREEAASDGHYTTDCNGAQG